MPMSRYEIRNEYSLADPELYRAADKDDPEALLEGVAMAGLVGVLRQLGDLAEFAAEIFRDLHEEVMATAARGHGLMVRVQQLEAEVPSIEKAFLSQTNHSSFFYNSGVDWHSNQKMDQNLITQGDLPRFIMDSYEECRGPPRLFLLDKFDVAGAGACLKRYTDPSFFRVEAPSFGITSTDVHREKKTRKAKKKGARWRNGETPEVVLPTAHAKLHQLFLEEHVENGVSNPARRVKLKRKLNGFPFNSKNGKSYMEKLLNSSSPEHKVVREASSRSSALKLPMHDTDETGVKVIEVRTVSPNREIVGRDRSPPSSPDRESELQPSVYEPNEISADERISDEPKLNPNYGEDENSFALQGVTGEKDIAVDEESTTEGSLDGYQSDDIASERDNYVDAPSTMDSEMDTDSELRGKCDLVTSNIKRQRSISDANEEPLQAHSSDSQSVATSSLSDDGNNSCKKGISNFSLSGTPSISAENSPSDRDAPAEVSPASNVPETDNIDKSSHQQTRHGGKCDLVTLNIKRQRSISDANEERLQAHSSDSQSVATSSLSDDGNNSCKKGISSFSLSGTPSISAENSPSDRDAPAEVSPASNVPETDDIDKSSHQQTRHGDISVSLDPETIVPDHPCVGIAELPGHNDFGDLISSSCVTDSIATSVPTESELFVRDGRPSESDETSSTYNEITCPLINTEQEGTNMVTDLSSVPSFPSAAMQIGDDFQPRLSSGNHLIDESNGVMSEDIPSISVVSDVHCHSRDNSPGTSGEYLLRNDSDEDQNLHKNLDDRCMVSSKNTIPSILDKEVLDLHENSMSDHSDIILRHTEGCIPFVSEEKKCSDELDDESRITFSDSSNNLPSILDAAQEKTNDEILLAIAQTVDANDDYSCNLVDCQNGSPNLVSVLTEENSLYLAKKDFEPHDACNFVISAKETTENEIPVVENRKSCDSTESEGSGTKDDTDSLDLADVESSHCSKENIVEPLTTPDGVDVGGFTPYTDLIEEDASDVTISADHTSLNEVDAVLGEIDRKADQSDAAVVANSVVACPDDTSNEDDVGSSMDPNKLHEVSTSSGDLGQNQVETDNVCLPDGEQESRLAKGAGQQEAATSGSDSVLCSSPVDYDHPMSEVLITAACSCLDSEVENSSDLANAAPNQASLEQIVFAMAQETSLQCGLIKHNEDASTLNTNHFAEETIEKEIESPPSQCDHKVFPDTGEESLEELPQLKNMQNVDHSVPEGSKNSASQSLPVSIPSQPSVSELPVQGIFYVNMSGNPKDPLISNVPPINILPETSLINLEEMPPLPPLPPVQWRMSKLMPASASERVATQHNVGPFSPSFPLVSEQNAQNSILPISATICKDSPFQEYSSGNTMHSGSFSSQVLHDDHPRNNENNRVVLINGKQLMNSSSMLPEPYDEMSKMEKASLTRSKLTSFFAETSLDTASTNNAGSSHEVCRPLHQVVSEVTSKEEVVPEISSKTEVAPEISYKIEVTPEISSKEEVAQKINFEEEVALEISSKEEVAPEIISKGDPEISSKGTKVPEISSKEEKVECSSSSLEENHRKPESVESLPKLPVLVMPTSEGENKSPSVEDGIANGSRTMKKPRPRNPLIDAVVARDKSKLRKVSERIRPEVQKVDERDSLLEQIRTKSFNLKPAASNRPGIQGPNTNQTNLKVAAILEKANAMRQAFVGSDDDEDSWSDS